MTALRNCDDNSQIFLRKRYATGRRVTSKSFYWKLPQTSCCISQPSRTFLPTDAAYLYVSAEPSEWTEAQIRGTAGQIPPG